MDKKGVVAAAAALVLVVAGGASALSVVSGATTPTVSVPTTNPEPTVVIEYVDEAGNPVPEPGSPPSTEVRSYTTSGGVTVIESDVAPAVVWVDAPAASGPAAVQASFGDDHEKSGKSGKSEKDDD